MEDRFRKYYYGADASLEFTEWEGDTSDLIRLIDRYQAENRMLAKENLKLSIYLLTIKAFFLLAILVFLILKIIKACS